MNNDDKKLRKKFLKKPLLQKKRKTLKN